MTGTAGGPSAAAETFFRRFPRAKGQLPWLGFGRFPTMNWYFVGEWRRGEPAASDDAASAEWIPVGRLPSLRRRFSWPHMHRLFGELREWMASRPAARLGTRGAARRGDPVTRPARVRPPAGSRRLRRA